MKKLKTLKATDNVTIVFGEWFDKTYGNTYYDTEILINGQSSLLKYQYGYNAGDVYSIDDALKSIDFKVRANNRDKWQPYKHLNIVKTNKLKRDLFKVDMY